MNDILFGFLTFIPYWQDTRRRVRRQPEPSSAVHFMIEIRDGEVRHWHESDPGTFQDPRLLCVEFDLRHTQAWYVAAHWRRIFQCARQHSKVSAYPDLTRRRIDELEFRVMLTLKGEA